MFSLVSWPLDSTMHFKGRCANQRAVYMYELAQRVPLALNDFSDTRDIACRQSFIFISRGEYYVAVRARRGIYIDANTHRYYE